MIRIERAKAGHAWYEMACALRERDLLGPVGLDLARYRAMFPGVDESSEHFVAIEVETVIGCVLLRDEGAGAGALSQMVVASGWQGTGVGRMLVEALEERAFGVLGLESVWCHARREAYGFYERLGWVFDSEEFLEAGIPHRTMRIRREGWPGLVSGG